MGYQYRLLKAFESPSGTDAVPVSLRQRTFVYPPSTNTIICFS